MMWDSGYREGTVRIRIWSRTGQGAVVPWEVALGLRPEISGGGKLVVIWEAERTEALGMCAGPTCSVTYKQPGAGWGSLEAWSEGRPAYKILLDVIRNSQVALWQRISMSMQETQEMWVRSLGSIPGFLLRRKWHPPPVFLPEKSNGQRSLLGYSLWGHKEWDMAEWLSTRTL